MGINVKTQSLKVYENQRFTRVKFESSVYRGKFRLQEKNDGFTDFNACEMVV